MALGWKRIVARRLLLMLTVLVAAAWILSFAAPMQIVHRGPPRPDPDSDFVPGDKRFITTAVSERNQLMVTWGWHPEIGMRLERVSFGRAQLSAQTFSGKFLSRIGFEVFSGDDTPSGETGIIAPYWFLLLVSGGFYLFTVIRSRQIERGFEVQLGDAVDKDKAGKPGH